MDVSDAPVPAHPVVEIVVTGESVTVDGEVVDRGSAGGPDAKVAMLLGVHAAARRVAQPLGRPVRAVLRSGDDEKRLVVHPDGAVTEVEDTFPVVRLIAPPGARATHVIGRPRPRRRLLPVQRTRLAVAAAYVALGVVLVSGFVLGVSGSDEPDPVADGALEAPGGAVSPHEVVLGRELQRLPGLSDVSAAAGAGVLRLQVTTGRAARVQVLASPLGSDGASRLWTIRTHGATTRTLAADDVDPGTYRWVARTPGEPPRTGRLVVLPTPDPPVVVAADEPADPATTPDPPPPPSEDANADDNDDGSAGDSSIPGPSGPVDPDDPTSP